jgi:hypothetical protein
MSSFNYWRCGKNTTAICDYAGNGINVSSITNWSFGNQSFISNTFEAVEIEIYNTNVVEVREDKEEINKTSLNDMLVGPLGSMTAYVYINEELTEDEARQVEIEFNILRSDGSPLSARATDISEYEKKDVYGVDRRGWVLIFEDIPLKDCVKLDVPEGDEVEPRIIITRMSDEIADKTAYPNVVSPSNILYADLSAPTVNASSYAKRDEVLDDGSVEHYISLLVSACDVENYKTVAGMLGTKVALSLGGGIVGRASVKYLLSDSATPPESKSGYTGAFELCENQFVPVGEYSIANKVTD